MRAGCLLSLLALVLSACFLPGVLFRLQYGRPPLTTAEYRASIQIEEGMTPDEVRAIIGPPHKVHADFGGEGQEAWIYFTDSLELNYLGVWFGTTGRVYSRWIH
jgi:outer membrane protein assembly factor BamE (lipoprotein component of BamABCDE complex)